MSVVSSDITFLMSACLPGRNLCTPESVVVEHREAGYHVILPGNLEWGASNPSPPGRTVVVTKAHGSGCWDLGARGPDGCSGPSGNGTPVGGGFLAAKGQVADERLTNWSHPPGSNRRPADYEKYAPAPNSPLTL